MRQSRQFYHSEKLQSTKTNSFPLSDILLFYHSEKLQSTKTQVGDAHISL